MNCFNASLVYRAVALRILQENSFKEEEWIQLAARMNLVISNGRVILDGCDRTNVLLHQPVIAAIGRLLEQIKEVREALIPLFSSWRQSPGAVVWGGRDVGQWFENAHLFFLEMDARTHPLKFTRKTKFNQREMHRKVSPLVPHKAAHRIDINFINSPQFVIDIILAHHKIRSS
jgi:cytidylate kinase